jgi:hypothetical protein
MSRLRTVFALLITKGGQREAIRKQYLLSVMKYGDCISFAQCYLNKVGGRQITPLQRSYATCLVMVEKIDALAGFTGSSSAMQRCWWGYLSNVVQE